MHCVPGTFACSLLQYVAVCCSGLGGRCVLWLFAVCCSELQCVALRCSDLGEHLFLGHMFALCCRVLQRVAARCSVSQ